MEKFDFAALWEQYMEEHQHPINRWLHVIALVAAWVFFLLAVFRWEAIWLVWMFVSYLGAMIGHLVFEKNRPTFSAYIKEHGWNLKDLLKLFIVEEICVFYMMFEQLGLVGKPKPR